MSKYRIGAVFERAYPLALASVTMLALLIFRDRTICFLQAHKLSLSQLYAGVFGWAGVQTSGLLGVYGMVFSKNDGFIGKLKGSSLLDDFYAYVKNSLWLGVFLTVLSLPILIKNQETQDIDTCWYAIVVMWFSLFVWAIASFARVAMIFSVMVNVKDKKERIPG